MISKSRMLGVLAVARREENAFDDEEIAFLFQVANQVAIGIENALAYREIAELKTGWRKKNCTWKKKSAARWTLKELSGRVPASAMF